MLFRSWNSLYQWIETNLSEEGVEYIISMLMEPYDEIINPLVKEMSSDEDQYFDIPAEHTVDNLIALIKKNYKNMLGIDFNKKESISHFWFISKNKEEPRVANRYEEEGSELEQPLAIARDVVSLFERLSKAPSNQKISQFLIQNDDLRHVVRRCNVVEKFPYAEIQDNTIGQNLIPIDMLRFKLSFFGAQKFDPRSDKWLRICMYQGAPLMHEVNISNDMWIYEGQA